MCESKTEYIFQFFSDYSHKNELFLEHLQEQGRTYHQIRTELLLRRISYHQIRKTHGENYPIHHGWQSERGSKNENKKGQSLSNPSKRKTISTSRKDKKGSPKPINADENNNFDSFRKEMKELMVDLHGALTKHDNALEQVFNRLSTPMDFTCKEYGYDECEEGEVVETKKSADVTPDTHNTSCEKVSRF